MIKKRKLRLITLLAALALLTGVGTAALAVNTARSYSLTFEARNTPADTGDTLTVSALLTRTDREGSFKMFAIDDYVRFDPAVLRLTGVDVSASGYDYNDDTAGSVHIYFVSREAAGDDAANPLTLAELTFEVIGSDCVTSVSHGDYELSTITGTDYYQCSDTPLSITVGEPEPTPSPSPSADPSPSPSEDVKKDAGMSNFVLSTAAFPYSDVDSAPGVWDYDGIYKAYRLGLMEGTGGGRFSPVKTYTVAEALMTVARLNEIYNGYDGVIEQPSDCWYTKAVSYCVENGIIKASDFGGDYDREITRAEMAYVFARALPSSEFAAINRVEELPDVSESGEYGAEIFLLYRAGIFEGNDSVGTFFPNKAITRREVAVLIGRAALPESRIENPA